MRTLGVARVNEVVSNLRISLSVLKLWRSHGIEPLTCQSCLQEISVSD